MVNLARSLIRGATRLRQRAEDLVLLAALAAAVSLLVWAAWLVARPLGLAALGLILLAGVILRVAGTNETGE